MAENQYKTGLGIHRQDRHLASALVFDAIAFAYFTPDPSALRYEHKQFLLENPEPPLFDLRRSWGLFWPGLCNSVVIGDTDAARLHSAMLAAKRGLWISEKDWKKGSMIGMDVTNFDLEKVLSPPVLFYFCLREEFERVCSEISGVSMPVMEFKFFSITGKVYGEIMTLMVSIDMVKGSC